MNTCDSSFLTKSEFEKCKSDSIWKYDLVVKTNYIINFKTKLLPKYRLRRKEIICQKELQDLLLKLRVAYDTVLNKKITTLQKEMDKNQKFIQPNSYLSSLLSFQVFNFYPDINAILLNNIHLNLIPKTNQNDFKSYNELVRLIFTKIPNDLKVTLEQLTNEFRTDKNKIMPNGFVELFQGSVDKTKRIQYDILDFLLWTE